MNLKKISSYIFRSWKQEYRRNPRYIPAGAKVLPPFAYDLIKWIFALCVVLGILNFVCTKITGTPLFNE